ncbi:MAG: DNA polymerase III subunit chi [Tabrizicola sp.]|nr:DNA polymerase III subunit chi [Tabrizicola sp.]
MGKVMFYHLTRSAPADTLAALLPRALDQGWRVMLRGSEADALSQMDAALWLLGGDDSFLPHGQEGGPRDCDQPVLLGHGPAVNGAKVLGLIDGAGAEDAEIAGMERVWVLFDGNDPQRLQAARDQWKAMTSAGHGAEYWSEEGGRWEKKAESPARLAP